MRRFKVLIPLFIVVIIYLFFSGYRITPLSAANAFPLLPKDAELVEEMKISTTPIFVYKSEEENQYVSVTSEKNGVFYRSTQSTFVPIRTDSLQTVGLMNFRNKDGEGTYFSVLSTDEEVFYIEVGIDPDVIRKEIRAGESVSFYLSSFEVINFLYPTAYNKDGKPLFYYGIPKNAPTYTPEDIKWHEIIEAEKLDE
ncbi:MULTISPECIES: hypothetical protein [Sutcliffiella]|uniref:Uncharacterized protein n=1 Tax=Sutcliffiella cohnii TaxID=33932 RepID=A0A223KR37_9BACI|nr:MULTISPECIES: hypothetical protein [Sutcliffiella]AST91896.1 hypothetical protein BC6307_11710 [Sutcliffiella cohnii]WBL13125.1 hypothetical protein O1A01_14395 [Sutcliffiella sp. NC1]